MSLDDMDYVRHRVVERPHVLGPGKDFFTEDGVPMQPQPSAHTIHKVFSGSALDLNAMNPDDDDDDMSPVMGANAPTSTFDGSGGTILQNLTRETENERLRSQNSKTTVLVVNGSGYVASHVIAKLLKAGYTVRCTVSDMTDHQQQMELMAMVPEASARLTIHEVDISSPHAFRDVIRGCKYVIHGGVSAMNAGSSDVVKTHVDAVQALFDAIRTYGKQHVRRVVLTGSAAAVFHSSDVPTSATGKFNEESWNQKATAKTDPVPTAKIMFEREAWRLQKMVGVELTVILPSIMIGPSQTNEVSEAMRTMHDLSSGSSCFPFAPNMYWNFVDVRDVAEAHVQAMEAPQAKDQRYIVTNECINLAKLGSLIRQAYPHLKAPTMSAPFLLTLLVAPVTNARISMKFLWKNLGLRRVLDGSKVQRDLSVKMTDLDKSVRDSVEELIVSGHLPSASAPATTSMVPVVVVSGVLLSIGAAMTALSYMRHRKN